MKILTKIMKNINTKKDVKHGYTDSVIQVIISPIMFRNALISESDFIDCKINKPNPSVEKVYDFIYICLKQDEKKGSMR